MNTKIFLIYLLLMAGVTYLIRTIPLIVFREKIRNRFVQSVLYYMPYAVLGAMTFPAIFFSTGDLLSGCVGAGVGTVLALRKKSLLFVAIAACLAVAAVKGLELLLR